MGIDTPFRARFGIQSRVVSCADSATVTPNANTSDICVMATLSQALTIANPLMTSPYDGQRLQLRITSIVSRAIIFGTAFQSTSNGNLPSATTGGSKKDYIDFQYNLTDSKWDLVRTTIALLNADDAIALIIALG